MKINFNSIGIIHSPFKEKAGMPVQPAAAAGVKGEVLLQEKYIEGLADLDGFSHIYLIYYLHQSKGYQLKVIPFLDETERGLFATRAPRRPNPIGISVVRLLAVHKNRLEIENVDILDGTPLLDIKPFVPAFDSFPADKTGWLDGKENKLKDKKSDRRFG